MTNQVRIANRVSQLESRQLDWELGSMIDNTVEQLEIPSYSEELKIILKLYLSTNEVMTGSSPGMRVYNTSFCDATKYKLTGDIARPPKRKLALLSAVNLLATYWTKRFDMFERILSSSSLTKTNTPWLNLDNASLLMRSLGVVNFFVFLRRGTYLTLSERILGLVSCLSDEDYDNNIQFNRVQMDFMYREMICRALAEFLTTTIPLVDFEQLKNKLAQYSGLMPSLRAELSLSDKLASESNLKKCAICLKQPFNPHVIGCRHVFCYYCLQSRYSSDPSNGYVCLTCEYKTLDQDNLQRYKVIGGVH